MSGYTANKQAIEAHAKGIGAEKDDWGGVARNLRSASLDASVFTSLGDQIAGAYSGIVEDYAWYTWRVGQILESLESALLATAKNYGKAEKVTKDRIGSIGEQF